MNWLSRLKAHVSEASGLLGHRQNRQNRGSVSFGTARVAPIPSNERAADAEAEREARDERAAILEFEAGLSRAEAERLANLSERTPEPVRWRGEALDLGDLRPCHWCQNVARNGRCMAALRGELRAARDYSPTLPSKTHRCIGYAPPADDPDQRPGRGSGGRS